MDCFYPIRSCTSAVKSAVSLRGAPPRDKTIKHSGSFSSINVGRKSKDELEPVRSRSKSRERYMMKEAANKRKEGKVLRKRLGAAYMRSSESIATKETATFVTEHGLDGTGHTSSTESVSGSSSSQGISSSSDSMEDALTDRLRDSLVENRSITTEDVENKSHNNAFTWFLVPKMQTETPAPLSPTDSVGAVKRSIRTKFDYIRKNRRFANTFPDPPSDQSMVTTHSIVADEAGSLLRKGYRTNIRKKTELLVRKNELVKQILKQRHMAPRPGFDP
jgi:hypothetical protein